MATSDEPQSALLASLAEFENANDREIDLALANTCKLYGVAHMTLLVLNAGAGLSRNPCWRTTYPKEWAEIYIKNNYFDIDPVLSVIGWGRLAVDWSTLDWRSRHARLFFSEAKAYGVGRHGVTIPIRGPRGERSLFSVTSLESRKKWLKTRASCLPDLHFLSSYLHNRVMSGIDPSHIGRPLRLSDREHECMEYLAAGKIPKQIAGSLRISESAVRLYLRSAKRKLGAVTNCQAIARASFHELIRVK